MTEAQQRVERGGLCVERLPKHALRTTLYAYGVTFVVTPVFAAVNAHSSASSAIRLSVGR